MNRSCRYWIFLGMVAGAGLAVAAQGQSQWTGVYSEDQAKRGETAFADKCSSCHANDLSGGDGPSLKGTEFSNNWNDLSINDLFERVRLSMPADKPLFRLIAHGWNPQATWYVARAVLGTLGFRLRNPYSLHRQKAFLVPGIVPPARLAELEHVPTWDDWDPDQDRWYYDHEAHLGAFGREA